MLKKKIILAQENKNRKKEEQEPVPRIDSLKAMVLNKDTNFCALVEKLLKK